METPLSSLRENKQLLIRHSGEEDWRKSRVESLLGRHMALGWPMEAGQLLPYGVDDRVEVGFSHGRSFYVFSVPILKTFRKPVPVVALPRPESEELQEFKRRKAARVPALTPVSFQVDGSEGREHSLILSLSATGMAFNSKRPISAKNRMELEIHLPGATASVTVAGEVVQCGRVPQSREEMYKIRVKFLSMGGKTRDLLFLFVRDKERQMKELGLE